MLAHSAGRVAQVNRARTLVDWNTVVDAAFHDIAVLADSQRFCGYLGRCHINGLDLFQIRAHSSQVRKRICPERTDTSGTILVHLQSKGTSTNTQGKRCERLQCGEAVLCNPDDDYSVDFDSAYEMLVLRIPTAVIAARHPNVYLEELTARRLDAHRSRLLLAFLRTAWSQLDCLEGDPDWHECVSETILDLLARAIRRSGEIRGIGSPRGLDSAVLDYIRRNITDPSLRTSSVAESFGVSTRTVQYVFERMATTSSAFILSLRLRLAAEWLRGTHGSITQIALESGFNDPAYFARCFRKQYGVTPREYAHR